MLTSQEKPVWKIEAKSSYLNLNLAELLSYRHLLFRLVRKEFLINYQQTLLGPIWILFQPLLTMVTYVFVFNKIIGVSIGSKIPAVLFYFSGIVLWNFFNDSFGATSKTFRDNISVFSKVYFPRLIVPLASIITQSFRFLIQFIFLIIILLIFIFARGFDFHFSPYAVAVPFIVIIVGLLSLSLGLIMSVLTAKYRDLGNFVDIFVRILLFITPVIYPLSSVKENIRWVVQLNPLAPLFELFRLGVLGEGTVSPWGLAYSIAFTLVSLLMAILLFNKMGSKLIDVI
ncbi:MAG: ABC transporter permease [Bacteroidota bacterium]|nr:ABC transporter permease [Ferruginibacter sp.]